MTNEVKNVPELRFPGFSGEWEEKKLGEISEKPMYGIGASATNFDGENVYVRITDINEKNRTLINSTLTSPDTIDLKYNLSKNDILFARTGASTGKTYIHKNYDKNKTYYFAGFLIKFKINNSSIPEFVFQYTFTNNYHNWVATMSIRSGQPGINSEEYSKMSLYLPSYSEQQKIGEFFSKLDQQIELEEKKLALLEEQKKGYMQKIFSQELRFKDENNYSDWNHFKLKDITVSLKGQESTTKELPILTISASRGWLNQKERFSQVIAGNSLRKYTHIKKGDLSYNKGNSKLAKYGIVYMLKEDEALVPNVYKSFRPNNNIDSYFLEKYFHNKSVDRQLRTKISSTARMDGLLNISDKDFYEVKLQIPSYSEQRKIGSFFRKFDELILKQSDKVELLKKRKKGFLQKMFI
ncbi:restriction endonuclease subunit S [Mammaliicoccus fleurettii]|uniref:restriction endonuclease subunit S n=1 Tax=Mammaliicoccus fleurettii TaxID=150056 RepID=UPI000993FDDA|nr:restriction endonuclease subunit S [Mammaliicoccus fleurettii]OOV77041.1 hypothetical protein B2G86_07300 [Mammaliicoccus fleurettii]